MSPNTAIATPRKIQWASPAATSRTTAPDHPRPPSIRRATAATAATTMASISRFATFSPTSRLAPTSVPAMLTATIHVPCPRRPSRPFPTPAAQNAPTARAKTETRTRGRITASLSCDRPVRPDRIEASRACPGRTDVPRAPNPSAPTKRALQTYQEASNPTGIGYRRAR